MKNKTVYGVVILALVFLALLPGKDLFAGQYADYNWFWVFYEYEKTDSFKSFTVRPFFLRNEKKGQKFETSLMPIIYWRYKYPNRDEYRGLFGIMHSVDYTHKTGIKDFDLFLFPVFFYGSSPDKRDRYMMIWPFGGSIRGKFGIEKVSPYVFPGFLLFVFFPPASVFSWTTTFYVILSVLPAYMTIEDRGYKAFSIFWPLIQKGESKNRYDFRVLPFFSYSRKKGFYENYSYLMIFNYRKMFYTNDVHKTFLALFLYGKKWSDSGVLAATTILWPFFSWGYDKRIKSYQMNLPWPLIQIQDCDEPKIKKRIFFPFYGEYNFRNIKTVFVTPLYFHLNKKGENFNSDYYYTFLFIVWYFKREYKVSDKYYGKQWRYFKIWPLFNVEYNDAGDFAFNLLSVFPMRDRVGYEKLYQPFFSIFEYKRFRSGEKRLGFLMRLYFQRWSNDFLFIKIPLLFSYSQSKDKMTELSFFMYMFAYEHEKKGKYIRLFWIPIRIGDADPDLELIGSNKPVRKEEKNPKYHHLSDYSYYISYNMPLKSFKVSCNFF
ncbi:hypothetical protein ACFL20_01015 [Spirochaetota bacterium]